MSDSSPASSSPSAAGGSPTVVRVKLFGVQAQLAEAAEVAVPLEAGQATVAGLREQLARVAPALRPSLGASRFAVNHAYATEARALCPGDEVALVGLVGGG